MKAKDNKGNIGSNSIVVEVNNPWQKTFGGNYRDYAISIQQTTNGGYIVAGGTHSFGAGGYDVYVIKTDSQGNTGPYPPTSLVPNISKESKSKRLDLNRFFLFPFNR